MARNSYYDDTNKLNPQIAVIKNGKTCLEFLDRLKFEKNSAQVEHNYSRVRVGIQDYSGTQAIYKWDNLTPDNIRSAYEALLNLRYNISTVTEESCLRDFEEIQRMLVRNPGIDPDELSLVDSKISKYKSVIEAKKKVVTLFEERKILPYEGYVNPNNPKEHLITGCKIYFNPAMRIPIIFEISQGYGTAIKDDIGRVKYSNEHDTVTLKKMLSIHEARSILGKVVRFCDYMAKIATDKYYELKLSGYAEEITDIN